jgi:transcriptional regulator with XRE-family HTH domain
MTDYEIFKSIGERIRKRRRALGMSQAELAAKADISLPRVSKLENAKEEMKLSTFIKVAEALQISTDELIRANVPSTSDLYKAKFSEILNDCTASEQQVILTTVKQLKKAMRENKDKE